MIILKLGGSVVTDKSKPSSLRLGVIERLAHEIKEAKRELIIVHGGGSFGHPVAYEYGIQDGLSDSSQIIGVAKTRWAMEELNQRIVEKLISVGLPATSIQTSAVFTCEKKRINKAELGVISDFLALGNIPVLYGDVVIDRTKKVCILSGDQIVTYLARHMNPERVVLATDVDGVLDKEGTVIEQISKESAETISYSVDAAGGDVTGGMQGKVTELLALSESGVQSVVINAMEPGRVKNALLGKKVIGTVFEAGK